MTALRTAAHVGQTAGEIDGATDRGVGVTAVTARLAERS